MKIIVVDPEGFTGMAYYEYALLTELNKIKSIPLITSDIWILTSSKNNFQIVKLFSGISGEINKLKKGFNYFISYIKLIKYIKRHKVQAVHFQILELFPIDLIFFAILHYLRVKIIHTVHDIYPLVKVPFQKFFQKNIYVISDYVVLHNNSSRKIFLNEFNINPHKITIIPHGGYEHFINFFSTKYDSRKRLKLNEGNFVVTLIGSLHKDKGIKVLLDALDENYEPKIKFIIAGKPLTNEINLQILEKEERLNSLLEYRPGFINQDDLLHYFYSSDLILLPYNFISESGVFRYAQTLGIPILASNIEQFSELITDNHTGFLLKKAIQDLLQKK